MDDYTERLRQRAYQIWLDEGRPEGREAIHWDLARELVAIEDQKKRASKPRMSATKESVTAKVSAAKPQAAVSGRTQSTKMAEKKAAAATSVPTKIPAAKSAPAVKPAARPEIRAARKSEPTRTSSPRTPRK